MTEPQARKGLRTVSAVPFPTYYSSCLFDQRACVLRRLTPNHKPGLSHFDERIIEKLDDYLRNQRRDQLFQIALGEIGGGNQHEFLGLTPQEMRIHEIVVFGYDDPIFLLRKFDYFRVGCTVSVR